MKTNRGFTLIELLVVMAIIGILAALLLPALNSSRLAASKVKARADLNALETAVKAFYNDYGKFPIGNGSPDKKYDGDNAELVEILRAAEPTGGSKKNPRDIVYLEIDQSKMDSGDSFIDPWDAPYNIIFDTNFDNELNMPFGDDLESRTVAVWSLGPNGVDADESEYIKSWEE